MSIESECLDILKDAGVDVNSEIDFDVNGEVKTLSLKYILDAYMLASDESKLVFLTTLKKSVDEDVLGIDKFFEGMGQLLLMTHLSKKYDLRKDDTTIS